MGTSNRKPRAINPVSFLLYLALAAALYGGWKYIPPYYQSYRVGSALGDVRRDAGRFIAGTGDPREGSLLAQLRREVVGFGVDESTLAIYFGPDNESLNVEYSVMIHHWIGDPVEMKVHRREKIVPVGR